MRLRLVLLAQTAFGIGARGIEVAQADAAQTGGSASNQRSSFSTITFDSPYGFTGRIGKSSRIGTRVRRAVDGRGGREHEVLHAGSHHRVEQRERSAHIVAEIAAPARASIRRPR